MKIPEQYANTPNLWRLTCELSKFKEPYKVLGMMLTMAGPMLKEDRDEQHDFNADTRQRIAEMLEKIHSEKLLNRIYHFIKYIYLHREGRAAA